MANPEIETYRGRLPKCRKCGKPLRPQYETERRCFKDEGITYRRVYMGKNFDYDAERSFSVEYDDERGEYYRLVRSNVVKSRKFTGTFGCEGCNFFCSKECGFRWACKHLRENQ